MGRRGPEKAEISIHSSPPALRLPNASVSPKEPSLLPIRDGGGGRRVAVPCPGTVAQRGPPGAQVQHRTSSWGARTSDWLLGASTCLSGQQGALLKAELLWLDVHHTRGTGAPGHTGGRGGAAASEVALWSHLTFRDAVSTRSPRLRWDSGSPGCCPAEGRVLGELGAGTWGEPGVYLPRRHGCLAPLKAPHGIP